MSGGTDIVAAPERLEVRPQARLSFRRLLEVCLDSLAHRLLRSSVAMVIVLLAVAFLAFVTGENALGRGAHAAARERAGQVAAYTRFLRKASQVESAEQLVRRAARTRPGSADMANLVRWGSMDAADAAAFVTMCRDTAAYLDFFDRLPLGRRVLLVENRKGLELLDWLSEAPNLAVFRARLAGMPSVAPPGGAAALDPFLGRWTAFREKLALVNRNHADVVRRIAEFAGAAGIEGRLAEARQNQAVPAFFGELAARGLDIEKSDIANITEGLAQHRDVNWAFGLLKQTPVRVGWQREYREQFNPAAALESLARHRARVAWIAERLLKAEPAIKLDTARLAAVAVVYARNQAVLRQEERLSARYGEGGRTAGRTVCLIVVSFLVCVAGIANAMLMSVLERFREIATMKCLGARNGTIAFLFITESVIVGVVGGIAGVAVGLAMAFARLLAQHGGLVLARLPGHELAAIAAGCLACGLFLAMLAAILPARVASRMAPMEAMRIQ